MFRHNCFLIFFVLLLSSASYAEKISIFGTIQNGTTRGLGKADSIRMMALQGAMVPLSEIGPQSGKFRFPEMDLPEGAPILLQVQYQGVNYNKMIPPTTMFRTSPQEITVYDTGANRKQVSIKSLMQVMREKKGLRVFKLFLIDNASNPPKSYDSKSGGALEYSVAKEATEIMAQLQQPGSKMAIPLGVPEGPNGGKILDRAILPGSSELQVSYLIPNSQDSFSERMLIESENGKYPIFVKPQDMEVITNEKTPVVKLDKDVPKGLSAYVLNALEFGTVVEFRFKGGKALPSMANSPNPEIWNGSILTSWDLSLFAVIGFLGLLFTLSFIFVYRKQTERKNNL
ncbi:hypothetical protein EHQ92_01175 [Leptospira biflexa]|uniref:hypothetical protein n=1 Tax=Leptospira biflexa TaxID=172 RepID=UPI001082D3F6|nr:hypothetical protein [Leptospira biflexa]TGM31880.1 hypothetical protein EHQ89_16110 [Leptospira biflexa]TGM37022.1 hypothetical protein EHQ80_05315 [Leptospira biflexa]TGM46566.1 hypothetical protein EHQ92_01175 [Leptospira biflexa]TGM50971.1 hypothetical protein EHQ88_11910 [Leptospira biflexa]TGM56244.1 hypothetical protein EHQ91_15300 [Leptospira biflexa]